MLSDVFNNSPEKSSNRSNGDISRRYSKRSPISRNRIRWQLRWVELWSRSAALSRDSVHLSSIRPFVVLRLTSSPVRCRSSSCSTRNTVSHRLSPETFESVSTWKCFSTWKLHVECCRLQHVSTWNTFNADSCEPFGRNSVDRIDSVDRFSRSIAVLLVNSN